MNKATLPNISEDRLQQMAAFATTYKQHVPNKSKSFKLWTWLALPVTMATAVLVAVAVMPNMNQKSSLTISEAQWQQEQQAFMEDSYVYDLEMAAL